MNSVQTIDRNALEDSPGVNLMPPMIFYSCLVVGGVMAFLFPRPIPFLTVPVRIVLGLVLGGGGFAFMMFAHETFKRIDTNVPTNRPATSLVMQGAFRYSRNPMYVGGSAFFWGIGLAVGSLWMLAAYIPLGLYLSLYVVPREEAYMERVFRNDYLAYRRNVRRWL